MLSNAANKIFVTGTGTGIGKTVVSAILAEALGADYWKPVQAGFEEGTDSKWVSAVTNRNSTNVHTEIYKFRLAASPHIAAEKENTHIELDRIVAGVPDAEKLIIEGPGGLMVPLNEHEFVADLITRLNVPVILVSRNYLGSINHSLLTALVCQAKNIRVLGWIFNDHFMDYENDIVRWTGIPHLATIPYSAVIDRNFIITQGASLKTKLANL